MSIVQRSSAADNDLDDIWDYIAQDNRTAARNFLRLLDSKFQMLAENPLMGEDRGDLAPALRCFSAGKYVIFFRPISGGVEIVRVLHGQETWSSSFDFRFSMLDSSQRNRSL